MILETKRLILSKWLLADAEDALKFWGDPEVMRFIDSGKPFPDVETTRNSLKSAIQVQNKHQVCLWPVRLKETQELIGCCGFHYSEEELELGYHFAKVFWGKGYAFEAVEGCLNYAFSNLNAAKIVAFVHPENVASEKVLLKTGFEFFGWDESGPIKEKGFQIIKESKKA